MARLTSIVALLLALALAPTAGAEKGPPDAASELEKRIQAVIGSEPEKWGVVAVRLRDGAVVYAHNPQVALQPASNEKVLTTAAALDALGPDWTTRTSVYATARPGGDGVLRGDLVLYGRGDPNLSGRFNEADPLAPMRALAARVKEAGVAHVDGALVADESYLHGPPYGAGWSSEDLQWYFGAEVSALSFNDGLVSIRISPGSRPGEPGRITLTPDVGYVAIMNETTTVAGGGTGIKIHRELDSNVIDVGGTVGSGSRGWSGSVSVHPPALYAAAAFRRALADEGIGVSGPTRLLSSTMVRPAELELDRLLEIASLDSRPLSDMITTVNKHSQNLHAELLLRLLGRERGSPDLRSDHAGTAVIADFLGRIGAAGEGLELYDGSGLSRLDRVAPATFQRLLSAMAAHRHGAVFASSLPESGRDGTLRSRLSGLSVRAKTGSLDTAKSLSGYLDTRSGERLAFSILFNDQSGTGGGIGRIDRIARILASQ